jgi:serine protease
MRKRIPTLNLIKEKIMKGKEKIMKGLNKNLLLALAGLLLICFAGISFGQDFHVKDGVSTTQAQGWVPDEILVKFKPGISGSAIAGINAGHGAAVISTSRFAGFKRLRIPKGKTVADMVEIYKNNPNVEYAEPNFIASAFTIPNDPLYGYQWHLDNAVHGGINMEAAWDISQGSSVIVAVVDTGVAYEDYEVPGTPIGRSGKLSISTVYAQAPDLASTLFVPGYDFVNDDEHANDDEGHGTHVTGTIAQSTNNGLGVAGVAFNAAIMPVKVLDSSGSGTYDDIADGIYFAADNGAKVINLSLGGSSGSITLEQALAYAHNAGVTIVCASGNDGAANTVSYPAAYDDYCIAVGATRYDEAVAYYSNRGASLDLTAPGGDTSIDQNGDGYVDGVLQQTFGSSPTDFGYWFYQGTSMATPHVSGVAALLIANGAATPAEVREALQATAEDKGSAGWDPDYGWGIVDAAAALSYTLEPNTPPVATITTPVSGTEDIAVTFDGSGSFDPDGDSLTYSWNFGDGSSGAGVAPQHTYTAGGDYTLTLTVNDGKVDSSPASTSVHITEVNDPPVADAGSDQAAEVGAAVSFDASGSYDIDDGIAGYSWDFGDNGATGTGVAPSHTYTAAGTYSVTLTVTDYAGSTATDTAIVTVTEAAPTSEMHVNDIQMDLSTRNRGINSFTVATAIITVTDASGDPVNGVTVYGSWSGATSDTDLGVTNAGGSIMLISDSVKNVTSGTTFTFTVDDVAGGDWSYNPDLNVVTVKSITIN